MDELQQNAAEFAAAQDKGLKKGKKGGKKSFRRSGFEGLKMCIRDRVGDDLGATVGNIINCSYKLMSQVQPDALLILGDTNSCLSAIARCV